MHSLPSFFFFFNDTATTEIYTLSLHDALPICALPQRAERARGARAARGGGGGVEVDDVPCGEDRKSTRLNSSHVEISYAVFCLKKKKKEKLHENDKLADAFGLRVCYTNLTASH